MFRIRLPKQSKHSGESVTGNKNKKLNAFYIYYQRNYRASGLRLPRRGFGIDLWHAVEFSRYERAEIHPHFHGPVLRRLS